MRNWSKRAKLIWLFVAIPPLIVLFVVLGGVVVQQLWNWLVPPLFGLPTVGFWQALGLLVLCRILFGGHGFHGGSGRRYRPRWDRMTPEERERVRQCMGERWGTPAAPDPS